MAIEVDIPIEIEDYKEKIIFGMSLRQLVCFSSAVAAGLGSYFVCTKALHMSMDAASYVVIFIAIPFMAMGFIKKDGQPFEKYVSLMIRQHVGNNKLVYSADPNVEEEAKTERMRKYVWIFEKKNSGNGIASLSKQERKREAALKEAVFYMAKKENRKRNRKITRQKIKAAQKERRAAERRIKKENEARSSTQKCD